MTVLAAALCAAAATPAMLAMAIMQDPPPYPPPSPLFVVHAIDLDAQAGRWEAVHARVDYRTKALLLVPDLWTAAPDGDREAMVELLQQMFRDTWERWHGADVFAGGPTEFETRTGPGTAVVEQLVTYGPRSRLYGFRYWLERRGDHWLVVDRTTIKDGLQHEPSGIVGVIRKRIASELGRQPTLKEFAVNAPSWLERVRTRTIHAADLIGN